MALPDVSRQSMLLAMEQFRRGVRSDQGPRPGTDWLGDRRHHYVLLADDGEPYPVKEIIRLAVRIETGAWPSRFWGGPLDANKYAERRGFRVERKDTRRSASHRPGPH
jgi:hypothetical protein